jgi:iron-sulfur cluster repair protein YtfE (RIC family)
MSFKPRPARDRSNPFAMLEQSHARLREQLGALIKAAQMLDRHGDDPTARNEVVEISAFFDRSVTRHEQDEEQSLFPRLRENFRLRRVLESLEADHRLHERLHSELGELAAACARGALKPSRAATLSKLASSLDVAYADHIEIEESQLFPAARAALDPATLGAIASEFQSRRGRA